MAEISTNTNKIKANAKKTSAIVVTGNHEEQKRDCEATRDSHDQNHGFKRMKTLSWADIVKGKHSEKD